MLPPLNNVALTDLYTSAGAVDISGDKVTSLNVQLFNNAAAFTVYRRTSVADLEPMGEVGSSPGQFTVQGAAGIKMRNNVAGSIARVFVQAFEGSEQDVRATRLRDPVIVGFTPITVSITASGQVGLVGELVYTEFTTDVTVAATTEATATTVVTGAALTADGVTPIVIEFYAPLVEDAVTGAAQNSVFFALYQDGASIGILGEVGAALPAGGARNLSSALLRRRFIPTAGAHTYSIRAWRNDVVNAFVRCGVGGSGVRLPGFIRISTA